MSQPCGQGEDGIHCRGDGTSKRLGVGGASCDPGSREAVVARTWGQGRHSTQGDKITRGRSEQALQTKRRSSDFVLSAAGRRTQ